MKRKRKYCFYILFVLLNAFKLSTSPLNKNVTEGASIAETPSVFVFKKDSLFLQKYKQIKENYQKENFVKTLKDALNLYETIPEKEYLKLIDIQTLIADTYSKTNNYRQALLFYKKTISLLEVKPIDKDNSENINFKQVNTAKLNLRIANSYQYLSLADSAKYYYKKVENNNSLDNKVLKYKAVAYASLSGMYQLDSVYNKAIDYAKKSILINKTIKNKIGESIALTNLGSIYLSQGNFKLAKEIYLSGINLINNDNSQTAVKLKADLYYNLAWAMRNLKEYKAYDYQELSFEIEDDLRDKEIRRAIEEVNAKYNVDVIKKQEENKRLQDRITFWVYAAGSILVILSLLYFLHTYKLRQRNLRLELSQTQLIQNQNMEKIKAEVQNRVLNATIDGKETERKEIAETLHDSVSALLSSANLHLMATKKQLKNSAPVEISKTQDIIAEASQKIRDLSHTLVSSILLKFGLKLAINELTSKFSNSNLKITANIENIKRYEQNFEIKIYNIIQELLNNIIKHSKANEANIVFNEKNNRIYFQISDNGIGFDKTKTINKNGLGLSHIEARVLLMKGDFSLKSKTDKGTVIHIELPIVEKEFIIRV
ncbi:tetratricopeptide repeat-containing sensor histidine kinase [uncultured Polaribacter sp.]|uniref:tetratricopeptide repeat-containing sensor histidine kinase n=1 Tax=uncultured Polaribacter sp. TaxID=174711 RepID=UPI0026071E62|nr:tetratricopeptide repeat-containing sensor histidine kinase [uncultured Polaribacter sp.]